MSLYMITMNCEFMVIYWFNFVVRLIHNVHLTLLMSCYPNTLGIHVSL